jgi:voltage-gated potassium channel
MSASKARKKYVFSFMAIIDLLAILPFYLPFVITVDLRVLRMVRLLRLIRLLKVNRYSSALVIVGNVLKKKSAQLISSMFVVLILLVISSVLMYNIEYEAQPGVFDNAFTGFWWAVATLTTIGYGDIYPVTVAGKLLGIFISFLGIGLMAVPIGIISAGFVESVVHEKGNDEEKKHYCPYCGKKID